MPGTSSTPPPITSGPPATNAPAPRASATAPSTLPPGSTLIWPSPSGDEFSADDHAAATAMHVDGVTLYMTDCDTDAHGGNGASRAIFLPLSGDKALSVSYGIFAGGEISPPKK